MASSGRFSAHCSPAISINTVYSQREPVIQSKGSAPRIHFGAAYNFFLQEHCDLTTGLSFSFGHISLVRTADTADLDIDEQYLLKSIWLPIELKFYTSEVRIDTSVYFKVGIVPSIHLPSRPTSTLKAGQVPFVTIRPFGLLILLGIGAKYDFSLTNSLCVGLSYYWDAPGIMYKNDPKSGSVHCHNNFLCIDISILF
ncbi:outer membrane beta-barrel protein [Cardinium endosymbiont of Culicoides punctatus]|uniref:outer membrane beta-barrel protein n=1 Tax=Cardinium endosymbiont of Culicoides punctatus TaxID=2304601 RepID=UPI001404D016|nr:outer membrane beta-barrel protein [Cardinium endosymbiont of Culicoides punctatus]